MLFPKMKSLVVCALAVSLSSTAVMAAEPCEAEDAACLRRLVLEQAETIDSLRHQLKLQQDLNAIITRQNDILQLQNADLYAALEKSMKLTSRGWYEHPALWTTVGVFVGVGCTALGAWAIGQAAGAAGR